MGKSLFDSLIHTHELTILRLESWGSLGPVIHMYVCSNFPVVNVAQKNLYRLVL